MAAWLALTYQWRAGSALHIFPIGVAPEYRRRGVGKALIGRALAHARDRGFRQVVADCTNAPSKQVFAQCGFSERGYTPYGAFTLDGDHPFAALDGGALPDGAGPGARRVVQDPGCCSASRSVCRGHVSMAHLSGARLHTDPRGLLAVLSRARYIIEEYNLNSRVSGNAPYPARG